MRNVNGHRPYYDLHTHTTCSPDSQVTMENYCRRAIDLGMRQIAFSDHVDFVPEDLGFKFFRPAAYQQAIGRCRAQFGDRLAILSAVEVGEPHRYSAEMESLLAGSEYGFFICSLPLGGGAIVFEPPHF